MKEIFYTYKFIKYSRIIRYFIIFVCIFISISLIKIYFNNLSIENNINSLKNDIKYLENEKDFYNNFYLNYLSSDFVVFFKSHESNILLSWEKRIVLDLKSLTWLNLESINEKKTDLETKWFETIESPSKSWHMFLEDKIKKISF